MIGYWFIWCNLIVAILYTCGYKRILEEYIRIREWIIYVLLSYILLAYNNMVLYSIKNDGLQFQVGALFIIVPAVFVIIRGSYKSILLILLSGGLLALIYCLLYVLFILRRGYEPSMYEWLLLACFIVIMLMFVIQKRDLFFTVLLTKFFGDILLFLHQQGQVSVKIGNFSWWEFVIFLWISALCFYESLIFIAKNIKFLRVN